LGILLPTLRFPTVQKPYCKLSFVLYTLFIYVRTPSRGIMLYWDNRLFHLSYHLEVIFRLPTIDILYATRTVLFNPYELSHYYYYYYYYHKIIFKLMCSELGALDGNPEPAKLDVYNYSLFIVLCLKKKKTHHCYTIWHMHYIREHTRIILSKYIWCIAV